MKRDKDDDCKYALNDNGKIFYTKVKWKMNGTWRLFIAKMVNPVTVEISNEWEATGSTFTMVFDSEEEAIEAGELEIVKKNYEFFDLEYDG